MLPPGTSLRDIDTGNGRKKNLALNSSLTATYLRDIKDHISGLIEHAFGDVDDAIKLGHVPLSRMTEIGSRSHGDRSSSTNSRGSMATLPTELYVEIFSYLPRSSHRSLLQVSRNLHDVVLPFLFGEITIFFGVWDPEHSLLGFQESYTFEGEIAAEEKHMNHAWDILSRIRDSSTFAKAVKHLRVQAINTKPIVFERRLLCEALQRLPHLRSFEFLGFRHMPVNVAAQLAQSCPALQSLTTRILYTAAAIELCQLSQLRSFRTIPHDGDHEIWGSEFLSPDSISDIIDHNADSLRELALAGSVANSISLIRVANNLTHFEIDKAQDFDGLELFLRHAVNLESLVLINVKDLQFFDTLPKDACRNFSSLKLRVVYSTFRFIEDLAALRGFCRSRPSIQSFDFSLEVGDTGGMDEDYEMDPEFHCFWFDIFVSVIRVLPSLKALGVTIPRMQPVDTCRSVGYLIGALPSSLVAFHASFWTDDQSATYSLVDRLAKISTLTFASFIILGDGQISTKEFVKDIPSLEQICLHNEMWDIDRECESEETMLSQWAGSKWMFREAFHFSSPEAFWLMAYYETEPFGTSDDNIAF